MPLADAVIDVLEFPRYLSNLHLKLGNLENRGEPWLGRYGPEEICCNSLNTVSRNIASLIPRDNGSPGLTPGPDGDSVTGTLAILSPLPHIGLTLPHCQVPSIAKLCFDQIFMMTIYNYCISQQCGIAEQV